MTVLWADPFQTYGLDETKLTDGLYAAVNSDVALIADPDPNASADSKCLRFNDTGEVRWAIPTGANATIGQSVRLWMDDLPSSDSNGFTFDFRNNANAELCKLRVLPNGQLRLMRGATTIADSTLPVITAGAWNHIETKIVFNDTTGTSEVRVNRNAVAGLTLTGQDTMNTSASGTCAIIAFTTGNGAIAYMKDFVCWDTNGSLNNNFLGTKSLYVLQVTADVSFNWDASTGATGYNLIDELTPDDADYIYADDAPPAASTFSIEDLPADIVSVAALLPVVRWRNSDGGDGNLQVGLTVAGDTDLGTDRPGTTAFTYTWDVSEVSPDTAVAYTPAEVNATDLLLDRTL
jgi:hypothetical protein